MGEEEEVWTKAEATEHIKNHPHASLEVDTDDALGFSWEGDNDCGWFHILYENGWNVTSVDTIREKTTIWIDSEW